MDIVETTEHIGFTAALKYSVKYVKFTVIKSLSRRSLKRQRFDDHKTTVSAVFTHRERQLQLPFATGRFERRRGGLCSCGRARAWRGRASRHRTSGAEAQWRSRHLLAAADTSARRRRATSHARRGVRSLLQAHPHPRAAAAAAGREQVAAEEKDCGKLVAFGSLGGGADLSGGVVVVGRRLAVELRVELRRRGVRRRVHGRGARVRRAPRLDAAVVVRAVHGAVRAHVARVRLVEGRALAAARAHSVRPRGGGEAGRESGRRALQEPRGRHGRAAHHPGDQSSVCVALVCKEKARVRGGTKGAGGGASQRPANPDWREGARASGPAWRAIC